MSTICRFGGCHLTSAREEHDAPYEIREGIPYYLALSVNRLGHLTDIDLSFHRENDVTMTQCLEIFGRTLDWVTRAYRPFLQEHVPPQHGNSLRSMSSPGGRMYSVSTNDRSYLVGFLRTAPVRPARGFQETAIAQWDDRRYISLLSYFITVNGQPQCDVGITFSEPASIERWALRPEDAATLSSIQNASAERAHGVDNLDDNGEADNLSGLPKDW